MDNIRKMLDRKSNAARTLSSAQSLYQRYGLYLAGKTDKELEPKTVFDDRLFRSEIKRQRRILETKWGNAVRLGDMIVGSQSRVLKGQFGSGSFRRPVWTERRHFSASKPSEEILLPPFIYFVPYDPVTREPITVYATSSTRPNALIDALKALRNVINVRTTQVARESLKDYRVRQSSIYVAQAKALYEQVAPLYEELKALKEYVESLE